MRLLNDMRVELQLISRLLLATAGIAGIATVGADARGDEWNPVTCRELLGRSLAYRIDELRNLGQSLVTAGRKSGMPENPIIACFAERAELLEREKDGRCRAVEGSEAFDDPRYYGPTVNAVIITLCPGVREWLAKPN